MEHITKGNNNVTNNKKKEIKKSKWIFEKYVLKFLKVLKKFHEKYIWKFQKDQ
jgi:hypothetical protein